MLEDHLMALPRGHVLRQYEMLSVLGAGGFGITYLARDTSLDKQVAIKEYLPSDFALRAGDGTISAKSTSSAEDFRWGLQRFLEEAKILAKFRHPNIVEVFQIFEANSTAYIVMDYIEGETLSALIDHAAPMDEAQVRGIIAPVLDGLRKVHALGFLHRDIKPGNIIVRSDQSPVLIDFGAARQALEAKSRSLTSVVTEGYAPIEQYASTGDQGPWTDIYALGAVAYKCLTGKTPVAATLRMRNDPLEPATQAAQGRGSQTFLKAVDWALAPDEQERPQKIEEWMVAFDDPNAGRVSVPAERTTVRNDRSGERTVYRPQVPPAAPRARVAIPLPALIGGGAVAMLAVAALAWFFVINRASPEDAAEWASASQADTIQAYERYARNEPQGFYLDRAHVRIAGLTQKLDEQAWTATVQTDTVDAYRNYMSEHPSGAHASDARTKLQTAQTAEWNREAEQVLTVKGLYSGPVDGRDSAPLDMAIRTYQQSAGLPVTGKVDEILMNALSADYASLLREQRLAAEKAERAKRLAAAREASEHASSLYRHTRAGYEAFLARYPESQYAGDIRSRLQSCHSEARTESVVSAMAVSGQGSGSGTSSYLACHTAEFQARQAAQRSCASGQVADLRVSTQVSGGGESSSGGQASSSTGSRNIFLNLGGQRNPFHLRIPTQTTPTYHRQSYSCEATASARCQTSSMQHHDVEICR